MSQNISKFYSFEVNFQQILFKSIYFSMFLQKKIAQNLKIKLGFSSKQK